MMMTQRIKVSLFTLGVGVSGWLLTLPSYGLPGQSVDEVKTWMQAHPTLRATSREGLRIHRAEIPSRRFTFQASVFPVGGFRQSDDENNLWPTSNQSRDFSKVRREEFILVDYDQPVTAVRLEESLRTLYGADVYADYRRAESVYIYGATATGMAQGELRSGDIYSYWLELVPDLDGVATIGKLNVVLSEDIGRLEQYLQRQAAAR